MVSSDLAELRPRGQQRELSRPLAYSWWQERLAAEFFGPERCGAPVLFFIDSAELERLQDPSQATDLCQAVSSRLLWSGDLFGPVTGDVARWRRGAQADPPPCLPLLATTVLAAVNMYAPMGPGAPAYYPRLAELLKPPGPSAQWHRDKLERRYNDVKALWICLDHWLADRRGGRGVSTIRQGSLTKIGYALSQAIIRNQDHLILEEFFRTPGVGSLAPIDGARLLRELKSWGRTASLSRRLRQALASEAENPLLVPLLTALAEAWASGREAEQHSGGTPPARLLVAAEEDFIEGWQLKWFLPAVPGVERDTLGYAGGAFSVVLEAGQEMYRLSGQIPEPVSALKHGLSAQGDLLDVRVIPGRHVLALREDPVAGAWVETSELGLFEQYVFLYDGVGERQLRSATDAAGLPWYRPEPVAESGWSVSSPVEFTNESQLAAALSAADINGLRHTPTRRMRLHGGLRVRPDLGRRHNYLLGAEPDLLLSAPAGTPDVLLLNGEPQTVPADGRLPLRGMGLTAKEHSLEFGGTRMHLQLHPLAETRCTASDDEGAEPGAAQPRHVVVPLRGDAGFLTAEGHYLPARHQREPAWWADRAPGLREGGRCRVHVPHEAVWLVFTAPGQPRAIRLLKAQEPEIGRLSGPEQDFWNSLILDQQSGTPHSALWRRYRTAVLGHRYGEVPGHV